jgi:hypothetical protein
MFRVSKVYPNTSGADITVSASQPITTTGTVGTVYACIGETVSPQSVAMSGEDKLKKLAFAKLVLLDRIRNVAKGQTIARVEVDKTGDSVTYLNDRGLVSEVNVSCGFKLVDADEAQATEFISGALDKIIDVMKERVEEKRFGAINP